MRRMHLLLPVLFILALLITGMMLTGTSRAQQGPAWLTFSENGAGSEPTIDLVSASSQRIELQAELPGAYAETVTRLGSTYTRLSGAGYGHPAAYGLPDLPVLRAEVEIPFGAQVTLEVISAVYGDHSLASLGLHPIYPLQRPIPKVEGAVDDAPFTLDPKFYAAGERYPSSVITLGEPYIVRGHRILPVEVWPVAYDPSQGSLRLYSQVTFQLSLSGADMHTTSQLAQRYASPAFEDELSRRVLNYNQGKPAFPEDQVGLLIISADAYADAMAPLVTLRQSRGFDVTLTRISEIPGGNTTSAIQAYIQDAYDNWALPPSYVLLVGDTNTLVTWTGPTIGTASDLYYATMDGPSDWHPDIGRGRFPVRSVDQTTYMVDKYIEYAALTGQEPWLKTASFPATCDNYTVAEGTHNYVIDTHTAPGGWTGTFPNNPNPGGDKLYCVTYNANHQDLIDQFSQGRWAIIYSGHGSYSGWEMSFTPTDIRNLPANSMYPFVASHACLSGDYGQPEVFGETWVLQEDKGAMVYWGSSTYTYWDEDDVLERKMFDSLFENTSPHADVTEMTYAGLAGMEAAYPGMARYYWETYNIMGDPSVHLFMEPDMPTFTLQVEPSSLEVCTAGSVTSSVEIGSTMGYSSTVYLENGEPPYNVSASFNPAQSPAPFTSTLTLEVTAGAPEGDHAITITATDQVSLIQDTLLNLRINTSEPLTPTLLSPADGATNQPFAPAFEWEEMPLVDGYSFELGLSPLFEAPLFSASDLPAPAYSLPGNLDGGTCYWWRAQADNACGSGAWAEPFHFSTVALGVSFYDDLESGDAQWTHAAAQGVDHWAISSAQSHSPTQAWVVPDDGTVTDTRLWTTQPITVGAGSTLTFWHRYEFEGTSYDGSVLELSTNGGVTWIDMGEHITSNGYNGTISSGYNNPLAGRQAWTGDLTTWTEVSVNLSSFAGQEVMLRWRLGCDSSVSDAGWYIDDVVITAPLPPNPAPILVSITPNSGDSSVPTPVEIAGANFTGAPALRLGDTWLESVILVDAETIQAVVPAGMADGLYDLALFNGDCQAALLPDAFTVTSEPIPISGLEASNDSPTIIGNSTHFSATVQSGNGISYTWNFGDGEVGSGRTPEHTYTGLGTFTAIVTATNVLNSETTTTTVTIVDEMISGLSATNDSPTELGNLTTLTATVETGTNITYSWDFGDGSSGSGAVAVHEYTAAGVYTATVTATNSNNNQTATTQVTIFVTPPLYRFIYLPLTMR